MSTNYLVTWQMHIEAGNAEEAAREALKVHRDPASIATVFEVTGPGTVQTIDLEALDERPCDHTDRDVATCGNCGRSWCAECDPGPSALCHWCHGRGYSTHPRNTDAWVQ